MRCRVVVWPRHAVCRLVMVHIACRDSWSTALGVAVYYRWLFFNSKAFTIS